MVFSFRFISLLTALSLTPGLVHLAHAAPATYQLAAPLPLDNTSKSWDYTSFDAATQRLFVTHGDHVDVIDTLSGHAVASIAGTAGAHGVVLAANLQRGYISSGKSDSIVAFDAQTFKPLTTFKAGGQNPDALAYDETTRHLLSFNGKSHDLTVLDATSGTLIKQLALGGKPEFVVIDDRQLFVNIEDVHQLLAINLDTLTISHTWVLNGCEEPTGLALDPASHRLFSVCGNSTLIVTNSQTGQAVASVAIGGGADAVIYDARQHLVFSSNGDNGTLSVVEQVDADHYRVVQTLTTQAKARTMAADPRTGTLYLPAPAATGFSVLVAIPRP